MQHNIIFKTFKKIPNDLKKLQLEAIKDIPVHFYVHLFGNASKFRWLNDVNVMQKYTYFSPTGGGNGFCNGPGICLIS